MTEQQLSQKTMSAVLFRRYGGPEVLKLQNIERPKPRANEVLVEVRAASLNSWDYELLRGVPFVNRMGFGLFRPKKINILGSDLAGVVVAVGEKVTKFQPGDEVFGDQTGGNWGGFAEFVCASEESLIKKPVQLSFTEAAALPQAGLLALQALRNYGQVSAGRHVLINGAGGGAGSFAIQLAKLYGAEVTAVDSDEKFPLMRKLGADHLLDFRTTDYTRTGPYDIIIDNIASRSFGDYKRALKPGGFFGMVGGRSGSIMQILLFGSLPGDDKKLKLVLHRANHGLEELTELVISGKIKTVIDRVYPLADTRHAFEQFAANQFSGKIVVTT